MSDNQIDTLIEQASALDSAITLMEVDIRQQRKGLAEYEADGREEVAATKRRLIAKAEEDLETIRAMWETMWEAMR